MSLAFFFFFFTWSTFWISVHSLCVGLNCFCAPSLSAIHQNISSLSLSLFSTLPSFCSLSLFMYPFPSRVCSDTPLHSPRVEEQRDWLVWCLLEVMKRRSRREWGFVEIEAEDMSDKMWKHKWSWPKITVHHH